MGVPYARRTVAEMKPAKFWSWVTFVLAAIYFIGPLVATLDFSLRIHRDT